MTRRDTIIFAVLINTGLLIVLFATAMKSDDASNDMVANNSQTAPSEVVMGKDIVNATGTSSETPSNNVQNNEVDSLLNQLSSRSVPCNTLNPQQNAGVANVATPATVVATPPASEEIMNIDGATAETTVGTKSKVESLSSGASLKSAGARSGQPAMASSYTKGSSNYVEVVVKRGDVLERIARSNGVSVDEIMKANNLADSKLRIGQTLRIPSKSTKAVRSEIASNEGSTSLEGSSAQYYTVRSGDNPWTIASKHHISLKDLLRLNNLDEAKSRNLKPGDKLRVK